MVERASNKIIYRIKNMSKNNSTTCPVMKVPVNKAVAAKRGLVGLVREYKGQKYYFCCSDCPPQFNKNPEKYVGAPSSK